jgi:hypothetical protein
MYNCDFAQPFWVQLSTRRLLSQLGAYAGRESPVSQFVLAISVYQAMANAVESLHSNQWAI